MNILRNDVLRLPGEKPRIVRVLWINPLIGPSFIMDLEDPIAMPEPIDLKELSESLSMGEVKILPDNWGTLVANDEIIPEKHRVCRDECWNVISALVSAEPAIFSSNSRGALVRAKMADTGKTKKSIYGYLRRYWVRGQTPNALLPDYANSGAKGKSRVWGVAHW